MRSSRIFRSLAIWSSAAALVGSVTVATLDAQNKKGSTKPSKSSASKTATAPAKIDYKGSPSVLKTSFGEVPLGEFEAAFRRMNSKGPYETTLDSLLEFLDVYADYRLKLKDAEESGLFNDAKVKAEIEGYRNMLAGPYILERELVDKSIKSIYDKRKHEVRAAHFLAAIKNPNDPADTLKAYKRALRAIEKLNNGESMSLIVLNSTNNGLLAQGAAHEMLNPKNNIDPATFTDGETWEGSDDKQSIKMGGSLGYFTGGMTVRQFEDAAFNLPVGTFTQQPVRSKFGYHVIELQDKLERIGGVKVSHILVQCPKLTTDTTPYYGRIDSIYKLLRSGADFATVARENSDDKLTKERGGDMEYINREERRAAPEFDATAYGLKDGEYSAPIRTEVGYHIIKRNGTMPVPTFEAEKEKLKAMYKRYYFEDDKRDYIQRLQKQYGLKLDSSSIDHFLTLVDSARTSLDSAWAKNVTAKDRERVIYTMHGEKFTIGTLVDSLNADLGSPLARVPLWDNIHSSLHNHTLRIAAKEVLKNYPDFEVMMEDYRNGIILFELENQRVWSKAVPDSAGVRKYYAENKTKFLWPERIEVSEIYTTSDSLAKQIYKRIMAGENFDSLAKQYTERPGYKEKAGRWNLLQKDENEIAKRAFNFVAEEIKEPFRYQSGYSIVRLNKRVPAMQKTFDEARQEVGSQYQEAKSQELRKGWVDSLRKKYNRQVMKDVLVANWKKANADKAAH